MDWQFARNGKQVFCWIPLPVKLIFITNAQEDLPKGTIRQFEFEVDEEDAYIKLCNQNGHEIFMGPKDVVLGDIKAWVAFTFWLLGEVVEFFEVKK